MIDVKDLFEKLSAHVETCKSASFVCNTHAAFESWFRVELIPVLQGLGYSPDQIITNYTYPNFNGKADLCVENQCGNIVFELKSFVSGQDANKKANYPKQIKKLENLIFESNVFQVLTLTTFIGYSKIRMCNYLNKFFINDKWEILEPRKLIKQYQLYTVISSIKKVKHK